VLLQNAANILDWSHWITIKWENTKYLVGGLPKCVKCCLFCTYKLRKKVCLRNFAKLLLRKFAKFLDINFYFVLLSYFAKCKKSSFVSTLGLNQTLYGLSSTTISWHSLFNYMYGRCKKVVFMQPCLHSCQHSAS
jgi:hypothetical protein